MLNQILPFSFPSVLFITFTHVLSWFFHFSKQNIPGLFKDFPGPFLEISRTFLWQFTSQGEKCLYWITLAWHCGIQLNPMRNLQRMRTWKHVPIRHALFTCSSTCMRESNKREHWEWKTHVFTHFMRMLCFAYLSICFQWLSFTQMP